MQGLNFSVLASILLVAILISSSSVGFLSTANATDNSETVPVSSQSLQCITPPAGLLGWWPGDGNTKNLINNNLASISGGVKFAPGKVAQTFSFNGTGSADVGSLGIDTDTKPFSIVAWVKPYASTINDNLAHSIVQEGSTPNNSGNGQFYVDLSLDSSYSPGAVTFDVGATQSYAVIKYTQTPLVGNQWNLVAVTYDGSRTADGMKIYINGVEQQTTTTPSSGFTGTASHRDQWIIGAQVGSFNPFKGSIDETEVYNRVLTPQEIQSEFNADSAGKCKPSILGWWPADGNATDISGHNHNGVISGGVTFVQGRIHQAFGFDGTSGSVGVDSLGIKNVNDPFSIAAWIKPQAASISGNQAHAIVADGATTNGFGNGEYYVFFGTQAGSNGLGEARIEIGSTQTAAIEEFTSPILKAGKWMHVVATYDGSNTPNGLKLYVNGVEQPTTVLTNGQIPIPIPRDEWSFGAQTSGANHFDFFGGSIDNVKIFSCVLSDSDVQKVFSRANFVKC